MRRPRVGVVAAMIVVAIVAVDCAAFRHFFRIFVYDCGVATQYYRHLPVGIGVVPLVDVAIAGALASAARWLRATREAHVSCPRASLPWFTYFTLHILALGTVVCAVAMPEAIDSCTAEPATITRYAAAGWAAVFGPPGETVAWIIFQCALLGVLISGPPLLLSWVGSALARRCAERLPKRRFRAMACLVSLGFAGVGLAVCLTPRPFEDELDIELEFRIVDESSGRPLERAFVRMTDPFETEPTSLHTSGFTDVTGRVRLTGTFVVSGERTAFQTMAEFSPWGRWLEVSAAGYRKRCIPLSETLGPVVGFDRPNVCTVTMARGATREGLFHDIAGVYLAGGRGFGGRKFEITPDGRFTWCQWSCQSWDQEYGLVKRRGPQLELVPVPHPSREADPAFLCEYRLVPWGDRLYLAVDDDSELTEFCRQALMPWRPSRSKDLYGPCPRQSDSGLRQFGLPRLSARVWAKFLAVQRPRQAGPRTCRGAAE